ncbi:MAG: hypothetical protein KatS3mg125_1714 [Lysobacterales bacterium]|jgi:hypothetical protein|nr:MAG: hypothetical protein KatS3mg125_1714 [Xanthomonadales bacterium]
MLELQGRRRSTAAYHHRTIATRNLKAKVLDRRFCLDCRDPSAFGIFPFQRASVKALSIPWAQPNPR